MKLSEDLAWRGLIKDKTFADINWLDEPKTFYWGVDASTDSLTIGNLAAALLARRFVEAGWKAVLLAGGATSLVGDPGGKTEERELKTKEEIAQNVAAVKAQVEKLFAGQQYETVNNLDWMADVKYLDFLRDTGKHFSMSELMQREFVTERLSTGISYAEFSYSLLQGYDFWWLFKNKDVSLQIGASDQWGNILSGVALIRKKESKEAHAFCMPLVVNKETGVKFGKSEAGAIWLDPARTNPTQFHQYWINVSDDEVENYLKIFTLLSKDEIEKIMAEQNSNPAARVAQKRLADAVTTLVHEESGKELAKQHANLITGTTMEGADPIRLNSGISLAEALVKTGLASSNSEARRVIEEGGVYINNEAVQKEILNASDYENGRFILRRGKKLQNSALVELV